MKPIRKITKKTYKSAVKPMLFKGNPEKVHDTTLVLGKITAKVPLIPKVLNSAWGYKNPILNITVDGIAYSNPIGLSGGYDKDAELTDFIPHLGMGFMEVGSITKDAYSGNSGTRLWRMPNSKSILVYYGLKNKGADVIYSKIKSKKFKIPVGINIAKTNNRATCDDKVGIADYVYSFKKFAKIGDFFTVNISCPNTFGGQPFHDKKRLDALLTELDKIPTKKPVYIKLSPDISQKERQGIAELSFKHRVNGFVCGNLTKSRTNPAIKDEVPAEVGGMSGMVVQKLSDKLIADMYKLTKGQKTVIGVGGVFNANDAYRKIKLGASLVEMITGLIYEGPQVVGDINHGLVELLKKDGYSNIKQAVGKDNSL